jgi:hypothetical protein
MLTSGIITMPMPSSCTISSGDKLLSAVASAVELAVELAAVVLWVLFRPKCQGSWKQGRPASTYKKITLKKQYGEYFFVWVRIFVFALV